MENIPGNGNKLSNRRTEDDELGAGSLEAWNRMQGTNQSGTWGILGRSCELSVFYISVPPINPNEVSPTNGKIVGWQRSIGAGINVKD
jgi:hypothetical protein